MEATSIPKPAINPCDTVLGYVLQQRIGAGGFGEVWQATAPGGLNKAVKFVYGAVEELRATREMAALQRVKGVNHPFLLSLERIEIVNGQLVIVTELADGSIKDRFTHYREQGLAGIPREELLNYLADTAEGLDFLHEKHNLQHLDVKPENLLVLGSHAKVADFGLIKDLDQACASMLTGLTPTYSPPELFDGRPNQHSDQYSLAIVYQEMLTGDRPFMGRTAAQLAAQHMHSAPALSALAMADRPIVARALSKQPTRRYASCREFIQALRDCDKSGTRTAVQSVNRRQPNDAVEKTQVIGEMQAGAATTSRLPTLTIHNLPAIADGVDGNWLRPTLVVGIGGLACEVLRQTRRRLQARHGDLQALPSVRFLSLDTAFQTGESAVKYAEPGADRDQLALPLRTPRDYRENASQLLASMSRRWLYNVPRSLQTESIRPLGRLAIVDHYSSVIVRLKSALRDIAAADAIQTTAQTAQTQFQNTRPQVYLLASISGGAGSGAVVDLAYAIRAAMAELGQKDYQLCGILLHAANGRPQQRDLSTANSYACLRELDYFHQPEVIYPGDASNRIPGMLDPTPPLDQTYLVHLDEEVGPQPFTDRVGAVADYLTLNLLTPAANYFRQARAAEQRLNTPFPLRSLGVSAISQFSVRTEGQPWSTAAWLADAMPGLAECGGARRVMLALPEADPQQRLTKGLQRVYGNTLNTVTGCGSEIMLCAELEQISLPHLLAELTQGCDDYAKVAARLHTRTDIDWAAGVPV